MEYSSGRKRRGFLKSKLLPLYRPSSSSSAKQQQQQPPNNNYSYSSPSSMAFVVHHQKDKVTAAAAAFAAPAVLPKQSNIIVAENINYVTRAESAVKPRRQQIDHNNKFFGVVGDCRIDSKASTYISTVQERFKHHEHTY
ncbi:hypothetical protein LINGRAHAP2_LOCUS34447 [Linum grandiflorum]